MFPLNGLAVRICLLRVNSRKRSTLQWAGFGPLQPPRDMSEWIKDNWEEGDWAFALGGENTQIPWRKVGGNLAIVRILAPAVIQVNRSKEIGVVPRKPSTHF